MAEEHLCGLRPAIAVLYLAGGHDQASGRGYEKAYIACYHVQLGLKPWRFSFS